MFSFDFDMELTLAEENYLKSIYHLSLEGEGSVSTNAIAENLSTKPASVTDMVRKLSDKKLIDHEKYRGVIVSELGKKIALGVIRKHRLWEVFLVEKLGFNWDQVHDIAEQMEHIKSPLLIKRLDDFLGNPTVDPHGDPIPDEQGEIKVGPQQPLADFAINDEGIMVNVPDTNPALLRHLDHIKMKLGSRLKVFNKVEYDGSLLISIDQGEPIYLSGEISKNIMMRKL